MFNLLRYSQLIALAVPIAVVVALTYLYRGLVFDSMVEGETHANVALTRTFANAIWPAHAAFVRRAGALERPTLASRAEIGVLDGDLRRLASGLDIVKVKIYDLHGLTVYSTDPRQIGQSAAGNPGFQRARDGYPVSNLTYRKRMDSWEGEIAERHILATYVPVHVHEAAPVEAVLEIYSDVTRLVEANQRSEWKVLAAVLGAMALLYAVVQLMLARYRRLLEEKERERAAQEERIRHQAYHDPLTGLPTRASFTEHLEEAMRRAKRAGWPLALLFLDLDLFKRVNDCLGHDAGDRLLRVAAERSPVGLCSPPDWGGWVARSHWRRRCAARHSWPSRWTRRASTSGWRPGIAIARHIRWTRPWPGSMRPCRRGAPSPSRWSATRPTCCRNWSGAA